VAYCIDRSLEAPILLGLALGSLLTGCAGAVYVAQVTPRPGPRLDAQTIRTSPVYLSDMRRVIDAGRESCYLLDQGNNQKRLLLRN
jgi:hypothetical protein